MQLCGVVLEDYVLPPRGRLKEWLAESTSLNSFIIAKAAAKSRGIVVEALPQAEAEALAARLTEEGYAANICATAALVPATRPRAIRYFDLSDQGLTVERPPHGKVLCPWASIEVLTLAQLVDERIEVESELVRVSKHGAFEVVHTTKIDRKKQVPADLIAAAAGDPLHLRIVGNDFNYARSVGSDPALGWLENFTHLLAKLGLRAEHAAIAQAYEAFIADRGQPLVEREIAVFAADEEYLAHTRWLWQRSRRVGSDHLP